MATFGWSYKSNASGTKRPKEQSRKLEEWQKSRPLASTKALHLQSHSAETLSAGTKLRRKFDPRAKIFVGNLDWKTTEATLADYFTTFGEIEALKIVKDHETGISRGFAFITYTEVESAIKCKKWCSYNHLTIDERNVTVSAAERRQVQRDKRKDLDQWNPTLFWEYKWSEDDSVQVYGPFGTNTMLQWSKAGFFDSGCWVRQTDALCNVGENKAKKARLVDEVYSDSSDSEDDSKSKRDPPGNEFVHVSEIDFAMFP